MSATTMTTLGGANRGSYRALCHSPRCCDPQHDRICQRASVFCKVSRGVSLIKVASQYLFSLRFQGRVKFGLFLARSEGHRELKLSI